MDYIWKIYSSNAFRFLYITGLLLSIYFFTTDYLKVKEGVNVPNLEFYKDAGMLAASLMYLASTAIPTKYNKLLMYAVILLSCITALL